MHSNGELSAKSLNKATKISGTGEKERHKFFNGIEEEIKNLKKRMV